MTMIIVTLKGIVRDRVLQGILMASLAFLVIPAISNLSMRQVTELSLTLCLSLASFILLLLAVFIGSSSIWKDMERRYTHSVLSLPMSRGAYLLGRFLGVAIFILSSSVLLGFLAALVVLFVSSDYPPQIPVAWATFVAAVGFDALKCIMLVAFGVFFSSVSTSFFLPVFGVIAVYLVGGASQQVYEYVHSSSGQSLDPFVQKTVSMLYYLLPNLSAFDLKVNAIYALDLDLSQLALTGGYFVVYTAIVLLAASLAFSRRQLG